MLFKGNLDGVFQLVEQRQHNCQALQPTIKRAWVRDKVKAMILESPRIKPKQIKDDVLTRFNVDVNKKMMKNALADVKRTRPEERQAFGFISSFLSSLAERNEGTTTGVMSENGIFLRAFICPGVCRNAFLNTTKISGLDACHITEDFKIYRVCLKIY